MVDSTSWKQYIGLLGAATVASCFFMICTDLATAVLYEKSELFKHRGFVAKGYLASGASYGLSLVLPGVAVAMTTLLSRAKEWSTYFEDGGVPVYDDNEKLLGVSKVAGWEAVATTATSRFFLGAGFQLTALGALLCCKRVSTRELIQMRLGGVLLVMAWMVALPISLAAFPDRMSIPARRIEPRIVGVEEQGGIVKRKAGRVHFSRGL
eukprot:Sspe_Gene.76608::Locus_47866_Transcript_1_1_Confidence_1.000_Length_1186::g.76608::m.76608